MAYSSDLDVVFLYDDVQAKRWEERVADQAISYQYYHRLAQQCMRILSLPTVSGRLYEVDTRLRPSGYSGFLVNSFDAYDKYLQHEAWTWEHQALIRARAILGSQLSKKKFVTLRSNILTNWVKKDDLDKRVIEMRHKMRAEHDTIANKALFHLKHSRGGIIDIEFLVQYLVLVNAEYNAELFEYTDNVRQLQSLAEFDSAYSTAVSTDIAKLLMDSYLVLRQKMHSLVLENKAAVVDKQEVEIEANRVIKAWEKYLGNAN